MNDRCGGTARQRSHQTFAAWLRSDSPPPKADIERIKQQRKAKAAPAIPRVGTSDIKVTHREEPGLTKKSQRLFESLCNRDSSDTNAKLNGNFSINDTLSSENHNADGQRPDKHIGVVKHIPKGTHVRHRYAGKGAERAFQASLRTESESSAPLRYLVARSRSADPQNGISASCRSRQEQAEAAWVKRMESMKHKQSAPTLTLSPRGPGSPSLRRTGKLVKLHSRQVVDPVQNVKDEFLLQERSPGKTSLVAALASQPCFAAKLGEPTPEPLACILGFLVWPSFDVETIRGLVQLNQGESDGLFGKCLPVTCKVFQTIVRSLRREIALKLLDKLGNLTQSSRALNAHHNALAQYLPGLTELGRVPSLAVFPEKLKDVAALSFLKKVPAATLLAVEAACVLLGIDLMVGEPRELELMQRIVPVSSPLMLPLEGFSAAVDELFARLQALPESGFNSTALSEQVRNNLQCYSGLPALQLSHSCHRGEPKGSSLLAGWVLEQIAADYMLNASDMGVENHQWTSLEIHMVLRPLIWHKRIDEAMARLTRLL